MIVKPFKFGKCDSLAIPFNRIGKRLEFWCFLFSMTANDDYSQKAVNDVFHKTNVIK